MTTVDKETGEISAVAKTGDSELEALWQHAAALVATNDDEMQERILRSVLRATTPHELLTAGAAVPATEVLGLPLTVEAIRASESDYQEGSDHYLHIDVILKGNGDRVAISTGARDVVTKLLAADMRGWLPMDAVIVKAEKPTRDGFYPLFLRPLEGDEPPF